jgi:2-dehydro-3-deoxyphosphogluconate aldolase/(4S)-4-hydroxy-2-oxoglutarate aldolase
MMPILTRAPVMPVLVVERVSDAAPLACTLVGAGLPVLEVTLRTTAALAAIRAMAEVPGALVGAGTIVGADDVDAAVEAGASFLVSPGLTPAIVERARLRGRPILPGVATASDILRGLELGLDAFKFFPAEAAGGVAMLEAFAGPFPGCRFCPTGGVTADTAAAWLSLPNVPCVGGSWVAPPDLVRASDWTAIATRASAAASLRP